MFVNRPVALFGRLAGALQHRDMSAEQVLAPVFEERVGGGVRVENDAVVVRRQDGQRQGLEHARVHAALDPAPLSPLSVAEK